MKTWGFSLHIFHFDVIIDLVTALFIEILQLSHQIVKTEVQYINKTRALKMHLWFIYRYSWLRNTQYYPVNGFLTFCFDCIK